MRCGYSEAVERLGISGLLSAFDPHVAGTPPLGIATPTSDIDILAYAPDTDVFAQTVWQCFGHFPAFSMRQWSGNERPVIASFHAHGWAFEIFGSPIPVHKQAGWRHFVIEKRLLSLAGDRLRQRILELRLSGIKTEPAFAQVLGLDGDPYMELLAVETMSDAELASLIGRYLADH